jgi:hypothetical protein
VPGGEDGDGLRRTLKYSSWRPGLTVSTDNRLCLTLTLASPELQETKNPSPTALSLQQSTGSERWTSSTTTGDPAYAVCLQHTAKEEKRMANISP